MIAASYGNVAATTSGFIARDYRRWRRRLHGYLSCEEHHYLYVAELDGMVQGHLAFRQLPTTTADEWVAIAVDELLAAHRDALLALSRIVATNRSMTTVPRSTRDRRRR